MWSIVLLYLCIINAISQQLFVGNRLWDAARNQGAKCLDGSEPHYFFRDGTSSTKWFIFYEGGGWCTLDSTLATTNAFDSCSYRKGEYLGTTKYDTTTLDLNTGYFSQDPKINPLMATWNMVYIRYCDGSSFTSDVEQVAKGANALYFRGARIRKAVADDLFANKNLKGATEVIIGGCSAGGLAANIALDWWKQQFDALSNPPRVTGLLDSSFFLEYDKNTCQYMKGLKKLVVDMNSVPALNQDCVAAFPGKEEECIFSQQMDPYVKTPIFALQPKFDDWQLWAEACATDTTGLNDYGSLTLAVFKNKYIGSRTDRGAFVDSCRHHCWKFSELSIGGVTNAQAFKMWYEKTTSSSYWIDDKSYECTACCVAPSLA